VSAATISPDPDGTGPLAYAATRNSYDSAGRLIKVEKGQLAAWQSEAIAPAAWTGFTVLSQSDIQYDAMGRKIGQSTSGGGLRDQPVYRRRAMRRSPEQAGSRPNSQSRDTLTALHH
jgi:hypothetical protein